MREPLEQGAVVYKGPCEHCGSSDARAHYDNGTSYCFSGNCRDEDKWQRDDEEQEGRPRNRRSRSTDIETEDFERGEVTAIEKRGLSKETCRKWQYEVNAEKGCHIANFRNEEGELVAQKLRKAGKKFSSVGPERKNKPLYGMWLWPRGGRRIVVTEGELDALSMSEAFDNKWPVVSLPDGADSAEKAVKQHYEYLCSFEKVILMFDEDKPGREAAEAAAVILPPGKALVAKLPDGCKDPNDVLLKKGKAVLVRAQWDAQEWRPDGIVAGTEFTREMLKKAVAKGYALRLPLLQQKMLGVRKGEVTLLTAGSGIGKSTTARQLAFELHQDHGLKFANVYLEEPNVETAQAYVALYNNVPKSRLRFDPDCITDAQWDAALANVVHKGMWFYNHFGSLESDNLITKLRYFAVVLGVDFAILDHISIVTSGMESSSEGERKDIDILMTRLSSLCQETGMGIIAIAHLKRAKDKTFNEGDAVSLSDLRGSASLEQLSHNVIAAERDQQADDEVDKDTTRYRILKCREVGDLGLADTVVYNRKTGWLEPLQAVGL